jgi:prepilin-type N-terminal cleavage/methylation domain-containing protein
MRGKAEMPGMGTEEKKNFRNNQQGFTFPELLMVLVLITIIAGISYGAFNRMSINSNLRTAARDIASDCQLARQRAMSENTNLTITFNSGDHTFTVPIHSINIPGASVVFTPRGTTQQQGTVVLINNRASKATIDINSTGRANVTFEMH